MKKEYFKYLKFLSFITFALSVLLSGKIYSHVVFKYNNPKKRKKRYQVKNRSKLVLEKSTNCVTEDKKKRVGRYNQITAASELYLRPVSELIEDQLWLVDENFADYIDVDDCADCAYGPIENQEVMTDKDYIDQKEKFSRQGNCDPEKECWMVNPEALSKKILLNHIVIQKVIIEVITNIFEASSLVNENQSLINAIYSVLVGCINKTNALSMLKGNAYITKYCDTDLISTKTCIVALANNVNENQDFLDDFLQQIEGNVENLNDDMKEAYQETINVLNLAFIAIPTVMLEIIVLSQAIIDLLTSDLLDDLTKSVQENEGIATKSRVFKATVPVGQIAPDTDVVNTAIEKMQVDFIGLTALLASIKSSFQKARSLQTKNVKLYKKNQEMYKKNLTYKSAQNIRKIDSPGSYTVGFDFDGKIFIQSDDVSLDLNGDTLFCDAGCALTIDKGCKNIIIKNGRIVGGDNYIGADCGVCVKQGAQAVRLENIEISFCYKGICFEGKDGSEIKDCIIKNCSLMCNNTAAVLCGATDVYFKVCMFKDFFQECILLRNSDRSYFETCTGAEITKDFEG
ncbi:hypothetical protein ACFLYA_01680 [Candidatus Dependentiae bacterium]